MAEGRQSLPCTWAPCSWAPCSWAPCSWDEVIASG